MKAPSFTLRIPTGDDRERRVCEHCEFIDYENPRIIVGAVVTDPAGKYLLCKRAIIPRKGYWTLPAGFLERQERPEEGAAREAMEEANAVLSIDRLLAIYTVLHLSQVQLFFRATLDPEEFSPGPESLEVALFDWGDIPWDELAFPTVKQALHHHREVIGQPEFAPFSKAFERAKLSD